MNVDLTQEEALLLLQCLHENVRAGRLDDSIRQGGLHAVASFSTLAEKLRDAANAPAQQPAEADMEAKQENP